MLGLGIGLGLGNGASGAEAPPSLTAGTLSWDSVRFPPENGDDPVNLATSTNGENGLLHLPNTSNIFKTTVNYDTPILNGATTIMGRASIEHHIWNVVQARPYLWGSHILGTTSLTMCMRFMPISWNGTSGEAAHEGRLNFYGIGALGTGGLTLLSEIVPQTVRSILWAARCDMAATGAEFKLDFWDAETGTKYAGTPATIPASWAGVARMTQDLCIGGTRQDRYPLMASVNTDATRNAWRGEQADFMIADALLTDGQLQGIALGDSPLDIVAVGNRRLWLPLASGGALDLTATSSKPALINGLSQKGTVYPGSSLKRQSQAKHFAIARQPDPLLCPLPYKKTKATVYLPYAFNGVSGSIEMRVQDTDGAIVGTDWQVVGTIPGSGSSGGITITLPAHPNDKGMRLTFRVSDGLGGYIYHRINSDVVVCLAGELMGQSELTVAINKGNVLALSWADGNEGRYSYLVGMNWANNLPYILRSRYSVSRDRRDGVILLTRHLRRDTSKPLALIDSTLSGTSIFDLLDDAQTGRQWADLVAGVSPLAARDSLGRRLVSATALMWEAFFSRTDWCGQALRPLVLGLESVDQGAGAGAKIAQGDINHSLYDNEEFSLERKLVVMPANRSAASNPASYSATTDESSKAVTRADMRNNAQGVLASIMVGVESTNHAIVAQTDAHPSHYRLTGMVPFTRAVADSLAIGLGLKTKKGPYAFTSYAWGGTNATVIATVDGNVAGAELDVEGNLFASSYGASPVAAIGQAVEGWEVQDGGAGAWTKDGFSAVVSGTRTATITKTTGTWAAGTKFRFHPGAPAQYTSHAGASGTAGTVAEDNWVKRAPFYNGVLIAGGNDAVAVV